MNGILNIYWVKSNKFHDLIFGKEKYILSFISWIIKNYY